jgi:hypothetical protein
MKIEIRTQFGKAHEGIDLNGFKDNFTPHIHNYLNMGCFVLLGVCLENELAVLL